MSTPEQLLPPLSIYLHWPWCVRKCPYCDFNSHALPRAAEERRAFERTYTEAVLRDLDHWGEIDETVSEREVISVFLGGGTPSLLSGKAVARLLAGLRARWRLDAECEITMEANPGTADAASFAAFAEAGVNRLSIGVQSFSDVRLKRIGRIHTRDGALAAIEMARRHFPRINLDLMYALPGETEAELINDLDQAADSGAEHLSCYQLTLEPGTVFGKRPPEGLPDADAAAEMGDRVEERLARSGFVRYEVSGYSLPGCRCRHNLNYWTFGDYLAAGPGAHGKLTSASSGGLIIRREARFSNPRRWLDALAAGSGAEERRIIASEELPFEFMLNALRLLEGVPSGLFTERTGLPLSVIAPVLERLRARGLLERDEARIAPTRLGLNFLSDVQEAFL